MVSSTLNVTECEVGAYGAMESPSLRVPKPGGAVRAAAEFPPCSPATKAEVLLLVRAGRGEKKRLSKDAGQFGEDTTSLRGLCRSPVLLCNLS